MILTRLLLRFLSALVFGLSAGGAWALDPAAFTSLGANPFTATGAYTIDSAANPPVLSRPGLASITGMVSGGLSVFTFDSIAIPAGATLQGIRNSGSRPVAFLSKGTISIASGAAINVSGANGLNDFDAQEDGGAAGPGGGGGGGGAGDEASGVYGNGGAGAQNGGNSVIVGPPVYIIPGVGGSPTSTGGGGSIGYGGGGGAFGGSGAEGGDGGYAGQAYGNLGVNTGGATFGTTLQGGSGGGGGRFGFGAGGGGGGGALEIGALGAITLGGTLDAHGGSGGTQSGGGGAGGGVYVHGSAVSLTGSINATGGAGANGFPSGGGGGGGRVFIFTSTGTLSGGSMANVNVSGGNGAGSGTATLGGPAISITVNTLPPGAQFQVDGTNYSSAQVLSVIAGSTHSLSTTTPQAAGAGLQRLFSNWSDGGALAHSVTPTNNITYTANFLLAATQSSRITNFARLSNGYFQLTFTNVSGAGFTVLAATNLNTPLTNWTAIGTATENPAGAGSYQYTDTLAPTFVRRFYDVKSP